MAAQSPIGVGIIGMGFMGRTHLAAYEAARRDGYACRIAGVCDVDPRRRVPGTMTGGNVAAGPIGAGAGGSAASNTGTGTGANTGADPGTGTGADTGANTNTGADTGAGAGAGASADTGADVGRVHADAGALLADAAVNLVSICTPTDTHVDLALRALRAGKHVLLEKPVALSSVDADRIVEAESTATTRCIPAMCMRFWPGWDWLMTRIATRAFGAVRSAVFQRLACPPDWSPAFYGNAARTGGALLDLHLHDVDFITACFGPPQRVVSTGSVDHLTSLYTFAGGPRHVVAEGGWDHTPGFAFAMRFIVVFDDATAEYDSRRDPPLMLVRGSAPRPVALAPHTGYDAEVRHALDVAAGNARPRVTPLEAARVMRVLEAERRSLSSGRRVDVPVSG